MITALQGALLSLNVLNIKTTGALIYEECAATVNLCSTQSCGMAGGKQKSFYPTDWKDGKTSIFSEKWAYTG